MLKQTTSKSALLCCAVIIGGFVAGCDQEGASGEFKVRDGQDTYLNPMNMFLKKFKDLREILE